MPTFRVSSSSCRRAGAIGVFHADSVIVIADSHDGAILAAYDLLDHISQPKVERVAFHNPNCDGEHCAADVGDVRVLPSGGDSNGILCRSCFDHEIAYRRGRNQDFSDDAKFDLPAWDSLEIYAAE